MKIYPIAQPYITKDEEREVLKVLRSGSLSLGPKYQEFEKKFAKKIGRKYACAVSSGTAGLHLAMIVAGIGAGDAVITTPFSFVASANCILYVGARPIFVDIDPAMYNIDPKKIEQTIINLSASRRKKLKAMLVVHIFGQSADMSAIQKIAKKYQLKIIEDACESIEATYKKRKVGTFGESAVFAFYPNKQITTGEGGMIVTDSKKNYDLCCSLRNQGRVSDMQWLDHKYLGYNYRLDEMSAAVGLAQLEKLDFFIQQRRKIAGWYNKHLVKYGEVIQLPTVAAGNTHSWFVYVIKILPKNIKRDLVIKALAKQGICTKPYLPSIHLFDFYRKKFNYQKGDFPVSEDVSANSLALPFYVNLKESDISYIVKKLTGVLKKYGK
ncbi:MAG: DegT/DnrJ/EryC1/StrS family aminotransferase [bacterium]|nr:DegT/DnrJ/EryC1/StrS family aminotransferase [bacterium]